jgi:hypothetical protein
MKEDPIYILLVLIAALVIACLSTAAIGYEKGYRDGYCHPEPETHQNQ